MASLGAGQGGGKPGAGNIHAMPVLPAPVYISLVFGSLVVLHLVAIAGFARTGRVGLLVIMTAFLLWPMLSNLVLAYAGCNLSICHEFADRNIRAIGELQQSGTLLLLVGGLLLLVRGSGRDA